MANRGGPKLKEFRVGVTSVRQWLKELEHDGLIVCEVYSNSFGNCTAILPTINNIMINIEDAENKVKWLLINVAKLEEEQRHLLLEEEKKKKEQENMERRKREQNGGGEGDGGAAEGGAGEHTIVVEDEDANVTTSSSQGKERRQGWDKVTIPKLEKYSGHDHPRPLWLYIKNGNIVYELSSANPPKMQRMITSCLEGSTLTEAELSQYDVQSTGKRKRRQVSDNKKKERKRVEVEQPPQYLLSATLNIQRKNEDDNSAMTVAAFSKKPGDADFTSLGQTERIRGTLSPSFFRTFSLAQDADPETELKFSVYDTAVSAADESTQTDQQVEFLGQAFAQLKDLLNEDGVGELKLQDENGAELEGSLLSISCRPAQPIGWMAQYAFSVQLRDFKLSSDDGESSLKPAIALTVSDANTSKFGLTSLVSDMQEDHSFNSKLNVDYYSKLNRTLRFVIYDADKHDALDENAGWIGAASIDFEFYLNDRKENGGRPFGIPITNSDDLPLGESMLYVDGEEVVAEEEESTAVSDEKEKEKAAAAAAATTDKVEIAVAVRELTAGEKLPVVALYKRKGDNYEYVAQTERAKSSSLLFDTVFLVDKTSDNVEYKLSVVESNNDTGAAQGTVLASALFSSSALQLNGQAQDLTTLDAEGKAHASAVLSVRSADVGLLHPVELSIICGDLPQQADKEVCPLVIVYSKSSTSDRFTYVGETEVQNSAVDPVFEHNVKSVRYSNQNRSIRVAVYDVAAEAEHQPNSLSTNFQVSEDTLLGEAELLLDDVVMATEPLVLNLTKQGQTVNGNKAIVRLQNVAPKPANVLAAQQVARRVGAEEKKERANADEEQDDSANLTDEQKQAGTSAATEDGSKVLLSFSASQLVRGADSLNPVAVLYRKQNTGKFVYVDHSERLKDVTDASFQKVFTVAQPQGSQLYKVVVRNAANEKDASSNDGKGPYGELIGQAVFDVRALLDGSKQQVVPLTNASAAQRGSSSVDVRVALAGSQQSVSLAISCANLPKNAAGTKCDPLTIVQVQQPLFQQQNVEVARSERLTNNHNPEFKQVSSIVSYSQLDQQLRFAVYDVEFDDGRADEKDLLGEARISLSELVNARKKTLSLTKDGKAVGQEATITIAVDGATESNEPAPAPAPAAPVAEEKPVAVKETKAAPVEEKAAEPTEAAPAPAEEKTSEEQPKEEKPAEVKPAEEKPAEQPNQA